MSSKPLVLLTLVLLFVAPSAWAQQAAAPAQQAQTPPSHPFAPPQAKVQYAPDRDFDLLHVALDFKVDYAKLAFQGVVVNTLAPLRDGVTTVTFHANEVLKVQSCEVAGQKAACGREGELLKITAPQALARGKAVPVTVRYAAEKNTGGFHWIKPTPANPYRVGFYTDNQMFGRRFWVPTWDYPNDFATSESRTTVPADWYVVGNGRLVSNTLNGAAKTRTFHWKMEQPHATYLLSLAAGLLEVKTTEWRGLPVMYVVPKGKSHLIEETFGETPAMLSFFSDITGVKYPWPKYSQAAMYDYGGGMEWVSATTMGEGALTNPRRGYRTSTGIVAHELAHQWVGDLVTCRDWGHLWLNEGSASFFAQLYFEHARGKEFFQQAVAGSMQGYIGDSRRYKRPVATNFYQNYNNMFDGHTYAKGAAILHTLRRHLGDKLFFEGIRHYLTKYRHTPVDSRDFAKAMSEATGINLEPFFDQWVFKPGHPVLDYSWKWDEGQKQVVLTVKQTQDTKDGTPIYDLHATVGLIAGGKVLREKARLHQPEQEIRLTANGKPDAVLLDPDHDFLREIPKQPWSAAELPHILKYAPNVLDREAAMSRMLEGTPAESAVQAVAEAVRADRGQFPVFRNFNRLGELKREDLRDLYRAQLAHPNLGRRDQAIRALGRLPKAEADVQKLRALVNDQEPYAVLRAAVSVLGTWEPAPHRDVFQKAAQMQIPDEFERDRIRVIAQDALAKADEAQGRPRPDLEPQTTAMLREFLSDVANKAKESPRMTAGMRDAAIPSRSAEFEKWLKELKSFTLLYCEDARDRAMERRGATVNRLCAYRMVTGPSPVFIILGLTADNKVTDIGTFRE